MAPLSALANISSEKFPTDFDRNLSAQDYELGVVEAGASLSFAKAPSDKIDATLLTLYGVLIKRYVREPDIEVGLVSGGKTVAVPLHGVMSGEGSLSAAIEDVHKLLSTAADLSGLPDTADLSAAAFLAPAGNNASLPRDWCHVSYENVDKRQLDVYLHVSRDKKQPDNLRFALRYNAKLLSKPMAQAMLRSWNTLVKNALADLSLGLNAVGVVSEEDSKTLLHTWNQTQATFPTKHGIHELFEANADRDPKHTAIVGPSHDKADEQTYELSYGSVESRANQLAHYLTTHAGVKPGSIVGVLLERSTTFYVAMLAILKAGGAYVSIDPEYPDDRIEYMLQDSAAPALVTTETLGGRLSRLPGLTFVHIDKGEEAAAIDAMPTTRLPISLDAERLCYVIYTSGSTGKPKGVQLSHANVLNLIRAEEVIYGVNRDDRVLQGFSTSFDASVEEIWMAFHNGATLVVGTKEIMRSGPDFPRILEQLGVTCLSTVPTLLSTVEEDFKHVRLIITGGEACSKELVNRWATPTRRFFNTYGPTEATVIATYKECTVGPERMSIGKPLANYTCYILDDYMQLLPPGAIGELVIGGVSVSRNGYLNLKEKTDSVFKPDTLGHSVFPLYKSGDLARFSPAGNIEYYGRADSQVKIRGYRVELSEIESVMCEHPGVKSAVVDVQASNGVKHLVAFVIPSSEDLDIAAMLATMRDKLPVFMIPSIVEKLCEFPTLPSGKVERRRLPRVMEKLAAAKAAVTGAGGGGPSETVLRLPAFQKKVALAFDALLGNGCVEGPGSNFFTLGGNSLMVSRLVTDLRKEFPSVTSRDVYSNPTVEGLANILEQMAPAKTEERHVHVPPWHHTLACDIFQTLCMYLSAAYMGLNSITIWILFFTFKNWPAHELIPFLAATGLIITFGALLIVVAAKWVVLGCVKEGDYPLWGTYHMRYWFVQSLDDLFRAYYSWLLAGTPLVNWYYRMLGAKIGSKSFITGTLEGFELIEIGDQVALNLESVISAVTIEDNMMKLRKVKIGDCATIGVRTYVQPGTIIGPNAKVEAMSLVNSGTFIPKGERWGGSPAVKVGVVTPAASGMKGIGAGIGLLQFLWVVFWKASTAVYLLPFLYIVRRVTVLNIYDLLYNGAPVPNWAEVPMNLGHIFGLFMVLQVGLFFVSTFWVAILKRIMLLGMNDLKVYPLNSQYYFRRWAVDGMMSSLGGYTKQLRGSIYLPMWYKVMGAKMGTHAEISSYTNVWAEKLTLGDHVFVADDVIVGPPHVEDGILTHEAVTIGNRAFVGNGSLVRSGTKIPDMTLVGVQSLAPKSSEPGETYVGSPPFKIKREGKAGHATGAAEAATYNPKTHMLVARYIVEALGFLLLHACLAFAFSVLYMCVTFSYLYLPDGIYAAVLPCFVIWHAVLCGALTLLFKWLIIGRFKAGTYPLYGTYVWRTELVERLEENLAQQGLYPLITGTVYMQLFFQAMGAKIGKRAYLDHPVFCEPDLVTVGDYVNIERTGTLQAHLFQDRVRTTGPVRIGNFCSIGSSSVVLIGGAMGDKATLSSLSVVMRSEELPPNSKWHGLPAKPQEELDIDAAKMAHALADEEEGVVAEDVEAGNLTHPHSPEELKEDPAAAEEAAGKEAKGGKKDKKGKKGREGKGGKEAAGAKFDVTVVVKDKEEGEGAAHGVGAGGKKRVVQGS